ncbi:hypothetical protein [Nocardia sp. NPDC049707]|uniref:hypothetical protein n=1 Tax=Nocardia sp. NPDC049707 TaxID=3154735 RepID=UPI00343982C7
MSEFRYPGASDHLMRFGALAVVAGLVPVLLAAGCGLDQSAGNREAEGTECRASFDVQSGGSLPSGGFTLLTAARHAASGDVPVKMVEITRAAGFHDEWDTMVVITPGMKAEKLNELANTPGMCWEKLPGPYDDDRPKTAYYLFLRDGSPLRAATWLFPTDDELDFRWTGTKVVHPDTLLAPLQSPGTDPKLRVAPAN